MRARQGEGRQGLSKEIKKINVKMKMSLPVPFHVFLFCLLPIRVALRMHKKIQV